MAMNPSALGADKCEIFHDFTQPVGTIAAAFDEWAPVETSAAGTPTVATVADVANGEYELTHDSQDEVQNMTLHLGDQLVIDPTKGPVFECKAKITIASGASFSADQRVVMGLAAARNATLDSNTHHCWFKVDGASNLWVIEGDDGVVDTNDRGTGVPFVDDVMQTFVIDMTDLTAVKFSIDGVQVGGPVAVPTLAASNLLQPYFEIQKDGGAETDGLRIDYCKVTWNR
ncbi:hypothetical protein CMI37_09555 [Candidatus Pacearchaeota archaeon]|nr:hypothetical protein [Candidatus Pacearchaeota archaeon]|tara:strand:- start:150 stop:836 length:687 start_codon:yes stop_codon:yes gene_type:complete